MKGIITVNGFFSLHNIVEKITGLPKNISSFVFPNIFPVHDWLKNINVPVFIANSEEDELVHFSNMHYICKTLDECKKTYVNIRIFGSHHSPVFGNEWCSVLDKFISSTNLST